MTRPEAATYENPKRSLYYNFYKFWARSARKVFDDWNNPGEAGALSELYKKEDKFCGSGKCLAILAPTPPDCQLLREYCRFVFWLKSSLYSGFDHFLLSMAIISCLVFDLAARKEEKVNADADPSSRLSRN